MPLLEDNLQPIQRRRLVAQLELIPEFTLTDEQDAAIDSLCGLLPNADEPNILKLLAESDRSAAAALLAQLPTTHVITRIMEGRWPE